MDEDIRKMTKLRDEIIDDMLKLEGAHLNGPAGKRRLCNNTHFRFDGGRGLDTVIKLSKEGIAVSAASACSAGSTEPSYVLTSLGLSPEQCMSALRISLSRYNTEDDVKYLAEVMRRI
jgi:cysteine desulfurase